MRNNPWDWDLPTIWWTVWILMFFVGEWIGSLYGNEMFTHHIWWIRNWASREGASIVLFLIFAILLWLDYHFILEGWKFFRG